MLFGSNEGSKDPHITSPSSLPMYKIKSYGTFNADTIIKTVTFNNFVSNETACFASQSVFVRNPHSSDFIPTQNFEYVTFNNVNEDAMAFLEDPNPKWINPTDCIAFDCTAPSNIVMLFEKTKFSGKIKPFDKNRNF